MVFFVKITYIHTLSKKVADANGLEASETNPKLNSSLVINSSLV